MKKVFLSVIVLFSILSCQEDVKFNNPSVQGLKDNIFWRATISKATIATDESFVLEGYLNSDLLTLKTISTGVQTYTLGVSDSNKVTFSQTENKEKIVFSTGVDIGDGQIVITEYDTANKTISGTFKFNAENTFGNPLAGSILNFQQGVFYKVPVNFPVVSTK